MKRLLILMMVVPLLIPVCVFAQETILVIESYHAAYPWDASYKKSLNEILGKKYRLEYFEMNTKRLPIDQHEKMAHLAWTSYQELKPGLVILCDDNALKHLGKKLVNTSTPVVYLGINNNPRRYNMVGYKNITGVLERVLLKRSIMYINCFLVKMKKLLVLFDSGVTSQVVRDENFSGSKSVSLNDISIDIETIDSFAVWKDTVLNAKNNGYDAMIIGLYHTIKDENGEHVDAEEIVEWTSENATIPPFAFWDFAVGPRKAIGGYVLFGEEQGEAAAKIALKILSGIKPSDIQPVFAEQGRLFFSQAQLKKWDLDFPNSIAEDVTYTE